MAVRKLVGIEDNGASTTDPLMHVGDVAVDTETGQLRKATAEGNWSTFPPFTDNSKRVVAVGSSATPAINTDLADQVNLTLAIAVTSMTTNLTGSPDDGDELTIRITGDATPRAITWGAKFTGLLLASTAASKTHVQLLKYDSVAAKWVGTSTPDATGY